MRRTGDQPLMRLRELLDLAVVDWQRAQSIEMASAAGEVFAELKRTDMRSGVANMIRRLAALDGSGDQPIGPEGWAILRRAVDLIEDPGVTPQQVRELDEELRSHGLDVDYRPPTPS